MEEFPGRMKICARLITSISPAKHSHTYLRRANRRNLEWTGFANINDLLLLLIILAELLHKMCYGGENHMDLSNKS